METRANYLLVASFVLAIVACSVGAAIWLLNLHPFPDTRAYDIYFSGSVAGLKIEAPVSLSGIPIGNVRKIEVNPEDSSEVHVTIEVRKDAAIRSDSIASLAVSLVFGDAAISITGGSGYALPLVVLPGHAYPIITSRPSQSFVTSIPDLVQWTMEVSDTLIKMLDDRKRLAISEGLQTTEQATARGVGQAENVGSTIDRADTAVREVLASDIALTASLVEMRRGLAAAQTDIDAASATVKQAGNWVRDFDNVVRGIRPELTDLTRNTLRDLGGTISDARELVGRLARYIDNLEHDPALFGKPRGGYRPK